MYGGVVSITGILACPSPILVFSSCHLASFITSVGDGSCKHLADISHFAYITEGCSYIQTGCIWPSAPPSLLLAPPPPLATSSLRVYVHLLLYSFGCTVCMESKLITPIGPLGCPHIQTKQIKFPTAILVAAAAERDLKTTKLMLGKTDYKPVTVSAYQSPISEEADA